MEASLLNSLQAQLPARVTKVNGQTIVEGAVILRRETTGAGFIVYLDRALGTEQRYVGDLREQNYLVQPVKTFRFLQ